MKATRLSIVLTSAALSVQLSVAPAFATDPGADDFGNFITGSNNDSSVNSGLFFDISGTAPLLVTGDDTSATAVPLGFAFSLYGNEYTELTFATNGYISTDPTDAGGDWTNDTSLPTNPSSGGGARIYAHHDDTIADIYGAYFDADTSPFGIEMYASQWDACHFGGGCGVQYNVFLLRDGTVVMAHNTAGGEGGSSATVGIQNETATDGYAYSVDEAGSITNGQTTLIIPELNGFSADLAIMGGELGMSQVNASASTVHSRMFDAFNDDSGATVGKDVWVSAGGSALDGSFGSSVKASAYALNAGFEKAVSTSRIYGISAGYSTSNFELGLANLETTSYWIQPYASIKSGNWIFSGAIGYGGSEYGDYSNPILNSLSASGSTIYASVSATGKYAVGGGGGLTLYPAVMISGGMVDIGDWETAGGTLSRPVENTAFYSAEMTVKIVKDFSMGQGYLLGGADYASVDGDEDIAFFGYGHSDSRVGGVLGAGLSYEVQNGLNLSVDIKGTGIGSDATNIVGDLSLSWSF